MPYRSIYVEPEVALRHKGVTVFHTYKDYDADERLTFWFSLHINDYEDESQFDVRTLPTFPKDDSHYALTDESIILNALRAAIDQGLLKLEPSGS